MSTSFQRLADLLDNYLAVCESSPDDGLTAADQEEATRQIRKAAFQFTEALIASPLLSEIKARALVERGLI